MARGLQNKARSETGRPEAEVVPLNPVEAVPNSVGELLRESRKNVGADLREAADYLRIRYPYLLAIEESRVDDLPGATYAMGFVRAYADYLGLDGPAVVERYKNETSELGDDVRLVFPSPSPEGKIPSAAIILVGVVGLVLTYAGWVFLAQPNTKIAELIPSLPDNFRSFLGSEEAVVSDAAVTASADSAPSEANTLTSAQVVTKEAEPAVAKAPESKPVAVTQSVKTASPSDTTASETASQESAAASEVATTVLTTETVATNVPVVATPEAVVVSPSPEVSAVEITVPENTISENTLAEATPEKVVSEPETPVAPDSVSSDDVAPSTSALPSVEEGTQPGEPSSNVAAVDSEPVTEPVVPSSERVDAPASAAPVREDTANINEATAVSEEIVATAVEEETAETVLETAPSDTAVLPPAPPAIASVEPRQYGSENANVRVVVKARIDSWVEIRGPDGGLLLTRVLRTGDSYRVPNQPGLLMLTGNAGGLEILVDGFAIPNLGPKGAVRRNVVMEAEALRAYDGRR